MEQISFFQNSVNFEKSSLYLYNITIMPYYKLEFINKNVDTLWTRNGKCGDLSCLTFGDLRRIILKIK